MVAIMEQYLGSIWSNIWVVYERNIGSLYEEYVVVIRGKFSGLWRIFLGGVIEQYLVFYGENIW